MKKNKLSHAFALPIALLIAMSSCTRMDDYRKFIEGGEISYTGKIDSVTIFSGDERVFIQGLFIADPKVAGCIIFWNSKQDSVVIPIERTTGVDTLRQIIPLAENLYNFELYTYDALGNRSIVVNATGRSYGKSYKASLNNRLITSATMVEDKVKIVFRNIDKTSGAFATDVTYTDNSDTEQIVRVNVDDTQATLENYKEGTYFSATTLYLPDVNCIDTFYAVAETYFPLIKLEKNTWTATADTHDASGGFLPGLAIDDDLDTYWHTSQTYGGSAYPHWLAVDMGEEVVAVAVGLTARTGYTDTDFTEFRVEGRNDESEEWVDYGSYTMDDVEGLQLFSFDTTHSMRYIRIYMLKGINQHAHLAEFSVYKH